MENPPRGSDFSQEDSLSNLETGIRDTSAQTPDTVSDPFFVAQKKSLSTISRISLGGFAALLIALTATFFFFQRQSPTALQASDFNDIRLPLTDIPSGGQLSDATTLKVRGELAVGGSLTLSPSEQPQSPISGQFYFDKDRKQMLYYDGSQFVLLQGGSGSTINNISNISTGGSVSNVTDVTNVTNVFNTTAGSITLTGTTGSLAMFTASDALGDSLIQQSGANLQVATSGTNAVTVGSGAGSSSTTMQGGTAGLSLSTGGSTGLTGSISITTGDSSTTASGNITIDSGSGIIDGEVVEDKTFESGVDSMQDWFNTTLATTTDQAHSGTQSLEVTPSSSFWGIIEILPGTTVTAGHQYHFSIWVRAATTPRTINASVVWQGAGSSTSFTSIIDNTTGWTEMTLTAPAPAGATSVSFRMQSSTGAAGDIHYFDDVSITDLSSGTAISSIDIGSTNAKVITIGNLNQIGATTIRGGSGIDIQSGAAATTIEGGTLNLTGNAASSLATTSGALTITSAASATWGVGTASSGAGGDLTLRGGQGGSDGNNDGGDLILQGGAKNGSGLPGSIIAKPQTDVATAFQIQNSSGTSFLVANSISKTIRIVGASGSFASLTLEDAHFSSVQTTAPTISTPSSCGTTPSAAITAGSTDSAGSFSITTGTGGSASTCSTTITFNTGYGGAPKSIIVVGKTDAVSSARQPYVSNSSATTFTTDFGVSAGGADNTTYNFSYWIVE